jgi:2-hydroxy-3-keto-5-methylthiopentenyl-1-phosphate phosphatase
MDEFVSLTRATPHRSVLVSDFDGTLAHPDFYQLVKTRLVPRETPNYWGAYRAGEMTHFEALQRYFAAAQGGEEAFLRLLDDVSVPDNLPELIARLDAHQWSVVVVSAGCQWYIDRLLQRAGAELPVLTNPGHIEEGRLLMRLPESSPVFSLENGIDKAAVVQHLLAEGKSVAYCGDGFTDFPAARLVPAERRFARADLAAACDEEGLAWRPFAGWQDVVDGLLIP